MGIADTVPVYRNTGSHKEKSLIAFFLPYIPEEREGLFETEMRARTIEVEIPEKNDKIVSISSVWLTSDVDVIVDASKPIQNGDTVFIDGWDGENR